MWNSATAWKSVWVELEFLPQKVLHMANKYLTIQLNKHYTYMNTHPLYHVREEWSLIIAVHWWLVKLMTGAAAAFVLYFKYLGCYHPTRQFLLRCVFKAVDGKSITSAVVGGDF